MAETRGETKRGFHALEKKIHELEESDRVEERKREAGSAREEEPTAMSEIRPPTAHDE